MLQRTPIESEIENEDAIARTSDPTSTTRYLIVRDNQFIISKTSNNNNINNSSSSMFTTPTASPTHMEYGHALTSVTPPPPPLPSPPLLADVRQATSPYGRLIKVAGGANSLIQPMMTAKINSVSHSASSSSGISLKNSSTSHPSSRSHCNNANNDAGSGGGVVPQNASASSTSIGVNLRVTGQCSQGGRKYMEDYFSVAYQEAKSDMLANELAGNHGSGIDGGGGGNVSKELEYAFFGIYDGHGGAEAALFAKENLMIEIVSQKAFWSDSDEDVMRAIREGYIATHFAMWREHERWPRTANGHLSTAGTTATVAFLRREKIYIGHVGDSGVVLGYQNEHENFWRAKQLTTDHKPESPLERKRIQRSGGSVTVKSGVPRVVWNRPRDPTHCGPIRQSTPVDDIPFLAVARSLGDLWSYNSEYNEFVVSPDPDVKVVKINPKTFKCLIFGTDGLWNVVTPQEAVDSVFEKERINAALRLAAAKGGGGGVSSATCLQSTNPSKTLVEKAIKTWSSKRMRADNTSVVTVILYPNKVTKSSDEALPKANCMAPSSSLAGSSLKVVAPPPLPLPHNFMFGNEILCNEYAPTAPYGQVAKKYLPPLEYRNFNYYEEEEEDEELVVEASMRLDYTDEDEEDDDEEDDEDEDGDDVVHGVEAASAVGAAAGLSGSGVQQYGAHLLASAPERSHCAWDSFDRASHSNSDSSSKSAWIKSALEVCMPQSNEWVELEIDRDSDTAISAEISTTSSTLTTTTCVPRPPSVVNVNYFGNSVSDVTASATDELYGEEVFVEPSESAELVELDVAEPHNFDRFMHSDNAMDADQSTTGYTFAESYNLLLNGQEARNSSASRGAAISSTSTSSSSSSSSSTTPSGGGGGGGGCESGSGSSSSNNSSGMSSPTTYQSIDSTSMQEILQEQQRYQEQEGYSLTKLETRREQQRSAASSSTSATTAFDDVRAVAGQTANDWRPHYVTQASQHGDQVVVSRYHERQEQLLELNSLLQQEREEERLVALEQREMQERLLKHNSSSGSDDDEEGEARSYTLVDYAVAEMEEETSDDFVFETRNEVEATAAATTKVGDGDEKAGDAASLQINEVSSSDVPATATAARRTTMEAFVQKTVDEIRAEDNSAVTFIFEQIKKLKDIEYTPVSKTVKAAVQRAVAIAASSSGSASSSAAAAAAAASSSLDCSSAKTRRMRYRNIPNENMMQTRRKGACGKFKRKTHSFINNAAAAIIAYNAAPQSSGSRTSAIAGGPMTANGNANSTKAIQRSGSGSGSGGGSGSGNAAVTATVRSPYATRNEVRISKRQLRSTVCNMDLTQRTLRTRNHALPKDMKNSSSGGGGGQKRTTTTTLGCGVVAHRSGGGGGTANNNSNSQSSSLKGQQQQQHAKEHHQSLRQQLLVKRAASDQTPRAAPPAKRNAPSVGFTPPVAYLNLRSRRHLLDESALVAAQPQHQHQHQHQKSVGTAAALTAAAAAAVNGKRFEYRRSLRRSNVVVGSGSGVNGIGNGHGSGSGSNVGSGNGGGGSFSKSTRLQSALSAVAARPPPSPKKLTIPSIGASSGGSNSGSGSNARQALYAAAKESKTTEVLVDFSKRWSLRSKRGATGGSVGNAAGGGCGIGTGAAAAAALAATAAAALAARTSLENAISCYANSAIASRTRLNRKR